MDPQAVEMGLASGRFPLQEGEASELEVEEEEEEEGEEEAQRRTLAALGAQQCRNDYLRSGLYSSFSISSLQNQPELLRALREHQEEPRSVIRFGANPGDRSSPPSVKPESFISPRLSKLHSPSSPHTQPSQSGRSWSPAVKEEEEEDSDQSAQPLNLSSGHRERALQPPERSSSSSSGRRSTTTCCSSSNQGDGLPPKSKKPKALEISAPSLLLAGSDIGSIALNSPALPSGSLTPAFFTAQVRWFNQVIACVFNRVSCLLRDTWAGSLEALDYDRWHFAGLVTHSACQVYIWMWYMSLNILQNRRQLSNLFHLYPVRTCLHTSTAALWHIFPSPLFFLPAVI